MKKIKLLFLILFLLNCFPSLKLDKICDVKSKGFRNTIFFKLATNDRSSYCSLSFNTNQSQFGTGVGAGTGVGSATGTSTGTGVGTGTVTGIESISVTASPAYNTASNWMDYIRRNMANPSSIAQTTITQCDGTEIGWYNSCIHTGEIRRFEMTNITDCNNVVATDSLGVFNWVCVIQTGKVFVYSTGLKNEKNLSDLIDFLNATFLNNSVTVTKDSATIATSTPSKWWTNPIVVQNTGATLSTTGTIYIVNSPSGTAGYILGSAKVALVVRPGQLVTSTSVNTVNNTTNTPFGWVEGNFRSTTDDFVITNFSGQGQFTQFRNIVAYRTTGANSILSLSFGANSRIYLHNIRLSNFTNTSTIANLNSNSLIINGLNAQGGNIGISLSQSNMIANNLVSSATNLNNMEFTSPNNLLFNSTLTNSVGTSLSITSNFTSFNNLNLVNGGNVGINNASTTDSRFVNTAIGHFVSTHLFAASPINLRVNGNLKISLSNSCGTANNIGFNTTCTRTTPSELSPATVTGFSMANTFVGKVITDDIRNTADTNGLGTGSVDPFNFDNRFRNWGLEGNNFPDATNRGICPNASPCRIWDWSLRSTDLVARATNPCPSGTVVDTHIWSDSSTITYLRNASEIFYDGVGNDNGICESNEDCYWTPNIGAYQGHGNLIRGSAAALTPNDQVCADIVAGTISNVKIFKFERNGY